MSLLKEAEALKEYAKWLEQGHRIQRLFVEAGSAIPDRLRRILTDHATGQPTPPSLEKPQPPVNVPGYQSDWIWVPLESVQVRGMILAVLAQATRPMKPPQVIEAIEKLRPVENRVSIFNAGVALEKERKITRDESCWIMNEGVKAPVVVGAWAFGPPEAFGRHELAAHRREAIKHFLRQPFGRGGLQVVQITELLREADWVIGPKSKDLVKGDILAMKGVVRRVGGSRKYELVE